MCYIPTMQPTVRENEEEFSKLRGEILMLNERYKSALKSIENHWTRAYPIKLCSDLNLRVMGRAASALKRLPSDMQEDILTRLELVRHKFFRWIAYKKARIAEKQISAAYNIWPIPDSEFRLIWTVKDKTLSAIKLRSECDKYIKFCNDLGLESKLDLKVNFDESIAYNIRVKVCEKHVEILRARFLSPIKERIAAYIKQGLDPLKIIPNLETDYLTRYNVLATYKTKKMPSITIVSKPADGLVSYNIRWAKAAYQEQCEAHEVTHNVGLLVPQIYALSIDGGIINAWFLNYSDAEKAMTAAMRIFRAKK